MNTVHKQKNKGFTLIETLVAISILLVATTAPLTFAQSSLRASFLARDQIGAFYLAQDVIETIKNQRDNTGLGPHTTWLDGLPDQCEPTGVGSTKVCNFDTAQSTINVTTCPATGCTAPLFFKADDQQYVLSSGSGRTVSKYIRTIYVTEIEANQEAQIVVEVKWNSSYFGIKRIVVQENIYNWIPQYR